MATKQNAERDVDGDEAAPPAWRDRAVERSLERSRAEAEVRSRRFVETALALVDSSDPDRKDFTIQDVVDAMRVSTKTFYQYFSGKDELLVAMFEELQRTANRDLRELAGHESDPLLRLRAFVLGMLERATVAQGSSGASRLLVQHYFRIQLSHPDELRHSYQGLLGYLSELIAAAADAGRISSADPARTAALLLQTVTTAAQASIIGSPMVEPAPTPEEVWEFCIAGIAGRPERDGVTESRPV